MRAWWSDTSDAGNSDTSDNLTTVWDFVPQLSGSLLICSLLTRSLSLDQFLGSLICAVVATLNLRGCFVNCCDVLMLLHSFYGVGLLLLTSGNAPLTLVQSYAAQSCVIRFVAMFDWFFCNLRLLGSLFICYLLVIWFPFSAAWFFRNLRLFCGGFVMIYIWLAVLLYWLWVGAQLEVGSLIVRRFLRLISWQTKLIIIHWFVGWLLVVSFWLLSWFEVGLNLYRRRLLNFVVFGSLFSYCL